MAEDNRGEANEPEDVAAEEVAAEDVAAEEVAAEDVAGAQEQPAEAQLDREQQIVDEPVAESQQLAAEDTAPAGADFSPSDESAPAEPPAPTDAPTAAQPAAEAPTPAAAAGDDGDREEPTPRVKPAIPGMDLEVDIVREGEDALRRGEEGYAELDEEPPGETVAEGDDDLAQPIADAAIDLGSGARYQATGKRKTAIARVILKPGDGTYTINGRSLDVFFPRATLQRTIRQPLETVGYDTRMDVIASMEGGGVSAQAGALRHGISRALIDADPNLRSELKRRGFLTRDARVKERKKAGLKKARKRPQFSKR